MWGSLALTPIALVSRYGFDASSSLVFVLAAAALALAISARVRAFQSGRLSAYLLYILVALILALSLVPILS